MYAEEDILYTIDEIFPQHLCILQVKAIAKDMSQSWQEMIASQDVVFEEM